MREPKKELKITVPVGTRFPFYTGALMKVFFSLMKNEEIVRFVREHPLPSYTDRSVTRIEDLLEQVEQTRESGMPLTSRNIVGVCGALRCSSSGALPPGPPSPSSAWRAPWTTVNWPTWPSI